MQVFNFRIDSVDLLMKPTPGGERDQETDQEDMPEGDLNCPFSHVRVILADGAKLNADDSGMQIINRYKDGTGTGTKRGQDV
jgi:hypothetical protein